MSDARDGFRQAANMEIDGGSPPGGGGGGRGVQADMEIGHRWNGS